jgi:putative hydrolase of the HAD superfamily
MRAQSEINNIIFDLGGVLLNVDYDAPVRAFARLGVKEFDQLYAQAHQSDLFDKLETGKISPETFRNKIREFCHCNLTDREIDEAWNSILLDFPNERYEFLLALKKKYRLFLLSNTNAIHIKCFEADLVKKYGKNIFDEVFEHYYYSSDLGMRKPHPETFEKVIQLSGLNAGDTLFIDDSIQHVEGAAKTGLHTLWLNVKKTDIVKALSGFL